VILGHAVDEIFISVPFYLHAFYLFQNIFMFTARRYAISVYAVVTCPSARLSIRPSHAGIVSKWLNIGL